MGRADLFIRQHEELLAIAGKMNGELDPERLKANPEPALQHLSSLAAKLKVHLTSEDSALYPALKTHPDPKVQATAKRFIDEMGGIAKAFGDYCAKWSGAPAVKGAPNQFIKETREIFDALGKRIDKENKELYPLV